MEFLKQHYEKIILGIVLLGLAVAAAWLLFSVGQERAQLEEIERGIDTTTRKDLQPLGLTTNEAAIVRLQKPGSVQLAGVHNVFNPVQWQRTPDGNLIKIQTGREVGAAAVSITKLTPLYLIISYEGVFGAEGNLQHRFKIERQAEKSASKRSPTTRSVAGVGGGNEIFRLREMKPAENPTEFVLELADDKRIVPVKKDEPYRVVAGYMADLRYDPEKQAWPNRRVGDRLVFSGDTNNIIAITEKEVVLSAVSTSERTTVAHKPAP